MKTLERTATDRIETVRTQTAQWWISVPSAGRNLLIVLAIVLAGGASYGFGVAYGRGHDNFDLHVYYSAINYWHAGNDLYSYSQWDPVNISLGYTYPPLAAVFMWPMSVLSWPQVLILSTGAIVLSGAACVHLVLRERVRLPRNLMIGATGLATAAAFSLEPLRQTLSFGQINLYVALLVLIDLLVLDRRGSRWTGIGIGLATGIKLTPGIFIIYLLITRRWRPALTAIGAFAGSGLIAGILAPGPTWHYFTSLMWQTSRVGYLDTTLNQSLNGLLARFAAPEQPDTKIWLLLAGIAAVIGLRRARAAAMVGDRLAGLALAGLVGALVSPVTWVHHIFWVVPALAVLIARLGSAAAAEYRARRAGLPMGALTRGDYLRSGLLLGLAIPIWCIPTATLMSVADSDYASSGALTALAGSVQLLWMLAALVLLPTAAPRPPGHREDATGSSEADPLRSVIPVRSVPLGSVPLGSVPLRSVPLRSVSAVHSAPTPEFVPE